MIDVKILVLEGGRKPSYIHEDDACCDCYARLDAPLVLDAWSHATVRLGIKLELPEGWKAVINPRSGLASRNGIVACIGEIDEGYRGELGCTLFNLSGDRFEINDGSRVCQLEFVPYHHANFIQVSEISDSCRSEHGFGSSGV